MQERIEKAHPGELQKDMNKYFLKTEEFGISEVGIHLLRSGFNFETIPFSSIISIEITKGKLIRNWLLILIIGIGLITFSIYYTKGVIDLYNDPTVHVMPIESIVVPILPCAFGIFCLYTSLGSGPVMILYQNGKKSSYALTEFDKRNEMTTFQAYLQSNRSLFGKLKIVV